MHIWCRGVVHSQIRCTDFKSSKNIWIFLIFSDFFGFFFIFFYFFLFFRIFFIFSDFFYFFRIFLFFRIFSIFSIFSDFFEFFGFFRIFRIIFGFFRFARIFRIFFGFFDFFPLDNDRVESFICLNVDSSVGYWWITSSVTVTLHVTKTMIYALLQSHPSSWPLAINNQRNVNLAGQLPQMSDDSELTQVNKYAALITSLLHGRVNEVGRCLIGYLAASSAVIGASWQALVFSWRTEQNISAILTPVARSHGFHLLFPVNWPLERPLGWLNVSWHEIYPNFEIF